VETAVTTLFDFVKKVVSARRPTVSGAKGKIPLSAFIPSPAGMPEKPGW
jgi:hypothetical protein